MNTFSEFVINERADKGVAFYSKDATSDIDFYMEQGDERYSFTLPESQKEIIATFYIREREEFFVLDSRIEGSYDLPLVDYTADQIENRLLNIIEKDVWKNVLRLQEIPPRQMVRNTAEIIAEKISDIADSSRGGLLNHHNDTDDIAEYLSSWKMRGSSETLFDSVMEDVLHLTEFVQNTSPAKIDVELATRVLIEKLVEALSVHIGRLESDEEYEMVFRTEDEGVGNATQKDIFLLYGTLANILARFCDHKNPGVLYFTGDTSQKQRIYSNVFLSQNVRSKLARVGYTIINLPHSGRINQVLYKIDDDVVKREIDYIKRNVTRYAI